MTPIHRAGTSVSAFQDGLGRPAVLVGMGIDAIEIQRIDAAISRRKRFITRVFTPEEREYCGTKRYAAKHWAARFAAKEAVMKALGTGPGRVAWTDISVPGPGKPIVNLSGGAAIRAEELGVVRIEVSLSHSRDLAFAVAAALSA